MPSLSDYLDGLDAGGTGCAYFDVDPNDKELVSQQPHLAEPALHFFVPVGLTKAAVRVPVCKEHAAVLEKVFNPQTTQKDQNQ